MANKLILRMLALAITAALCMGGATATELGANLNENTDWLDLELLKRSHATWARGFFDIFWYDKGVSGCSRQLV